jgi:hypothetical protein
MELHELEVGQPHAVAGRRGESRALRARRIGGVLEAGADAARRQHHLRGEHGQSRAIRTLQQGAGRTTASRDEIDERVSLEQTDVAASFRRCGQRLHHRRAGAVPAGVHDAVPAVAGLATERRLAVCIPVESHAHLPQPGDA